MRRAIAEEQTAAKAAGRPPVIEVGIVTIAEQLLAGVREAVWLDRAEAAVNALETISLRDLRAAVAGAAPRDDAGRELLRQLREAQDARLNKLRTTWNEEVQRAITEGRILQALRLSARLPEPSARFPAALVEPLSEAASAALTPDVPAERWIALLEAAVASPVRRIIKPVGFPRDDGNGVRQAAAAAAGRIPALATLLGLPMPPPPGPPGARSSGSHRPPPPRTARTGLPIPPPPVKGTTAATAQPAEAPTAEAPTAEAPATESKTEVVAVEPEEAASNTGERSSAEEVLSAGPIVTIEDPIVIEEPSPDESAAGVELD